MRFFRRRFLFFTAIGLLLLAILPGYYADAQIHYARTHQDIFYTGVGSRYAHHHDYYDSNRRYGGTYAFGDPGRDGQNGRNGHTVATSSVRSTIRITEETPLPAYYDVSGDRGSSGEDGTPGEPARNCRLPHRPPYNLRGATGGNGGNGGNGSNGSNGKSVDIYYTDETALGQLTIDAGGGLGGSAGRGAYGADGCDCTEPTWTVNFCEWHLLSRQTNTNTSASGQPDSGTASSNEWTFHSKVVVPCDNSHHARREPPLPRNANRPNMVYRWEYKGIKSSERYRCQDGHDGANGHNGQPGRNGRYGSFRLIPRMDIPTETEARQGTLKDLLGRNLQLAKNIWVDRQDLRSKLNPASNIPSRYSFLSSTVRPQFRLDWRAQATPESLGVATAEVVASVEVQGESAQIKLDIPGTLDYTTTVENNVEVAHITGGFSPSRVQSFRIDNVAASEAASQLVLTDEGDVRSLIPRTEIAVSLLTKQSASGLESSDYRERNTVNFVITPSSTGLINSNIQVEGNQYTLDLLRYFNAWLKPGYDAIYQVNIQQTTNSGVQYSQQEEIAFQVEAAS